MHWIKRIWVYTSTRTTTNTFLPSEYAYTSPHYHHNQPYPHPNTHETHTCARPRWIAFFRRNSESQRQRARPVAAHSQRNRQQRLSRAQCRRRQKRQIKIVHWEVASMKNVVVMLMFSRIGLLSVCFQSSAFYTVRCLLSRLCITITCLMYHWQKQIQPIKVLGSWKNWLGSITMLFSTIMN